MGFAHLDQYAGEGSWLERRTTPDQRLHLALAVAFAAGLMPLGARWGLGVVAGVVAAGFVATRLPPTAFLRRLAHAAPFFLIPVVALPVTVPGRPAFTLGPVNLSGAGLIRAAEVGVRAILAISAITIVISVTRSSDLVGAIQRLPLPGVVREALAMGYRYLYVLVDEHERTLRALESRGGRPARRMWRARAAALAHLVVRARSRTARIHGAMLSRGYREALPRLTVAERPARWTLAIVGVLAMAWIIGWMEAGF